MSLRRSNHARLSIQVAACVAFIFKCSQGMGQSNELLSFDMFKEMLNNHPAMRVAELSIVKGNQTMVRARGAFDPKLSGSYQNKFFKSTEYYDQTYIGVEIPLRAPIILQSGFENANGAYFNPEETTPNGGLINAGVAVPIGQGLITDKNRTEVRQAEAYQRYTAIEQKIQIQRLRYDAFQQYWVWWMSRRILDVHNEWVNIAEQRLVDTKNRFLSGDIASIDTLETAIQVQNRKQKYQSAQAKWNKESLELASHLWQKNEQNYVPVESIQTRTPQKDLVFENSLSNTNVLMDRTNSIQNLNPELLKYSPILEQLRFDERWKKEMMKPVVNLQYNALNEAVSPSDNMLTFNNYKWGAYISWPILMRKAKGELGLTRVKIEETNLEATQKTTILRNKALAAIQQLDLLRLQLNNVTSNVKNMQRLLDAERDKFNSGESSVFLINTREQQLFDLRIQETEIATQLKLQEIEIQYLFGDL
ncbi:MAG: TolC family protein [Flavobacteriales bacterium]